MIDASLLCLMRRNTDRTCQCDKTFCATTIKRKLWNSRFFDFSGYCSDTVLAIFSCVIDFVGFCKFAILT
jgi:hypothetical protein